MRRARQGEEEEDEKKEEYDYKKRRIFSSLFSMKAEITQYLPIPTSNKKVVIESNNNFVYMHRYFSRSFFVRTETYSHVELMRSDKLSHKNLYCL